MSIIWAYLQFRALVWLLRMTGRLLLLAAVVAVLVAAAPLTLVTAIGLTGAWLRGWPPARLWRAAAWALPMTAVYLAGRAVQARSWRGLALAPVQDWATGWHLVAGGRVVAAFVLVTPMIIPAGLGLAGCLWAWRIYALDTGLSGKTATAPVVFDARQWRRQSRAARARVTAPGTVPLADRHGQVVIGATIRAVGHRWQPTLAIPYTAFGRHQVIIGSSGSGKTNLMIRTWAGWYSAARTAHHQHGTPRPLLIVLDCKGGPDARVKAERTRRLLHAAGAARVAIWPDDTAVSLWALPPRDLAVTLFQMIESGTGPAAYYADVTQAALTLAITAPPGPPPDGAAFLDRLEPGWLETAYTGDPPRLAAITAARRHLGDISLRYRTLLDRLGPALDHGGTLAGADAWYFILEGTREQSVAEAQALALTELAAHAATAPGTEPRAMLLACDDYSAVSGKVPLWSLYERGRSLGIGVQVSAQSWQGLGSSDDERYRIAATADGGIFLLRTPYPQPISELAGTRRVIETATKVIGGMWGDEGSSRIQHAFTADPGIARTLATGQAGYLHAGGCTWVQVARPRPSPLPLPPPPRPPVVVIPPPEPHAQAAPAGPVVPAPAPLDDAFGPPHPAQQART
jgi:hypothetical protein